MYDVTEAGKVIRVGTPLTADEVLRGVQRTTSVVVPNPKLSAEVAVKGDIIKDFVRLGAKESSFFIHDHGMIFKRELLRGGIPENVKGRDLAKSTPLFADLMRVNSHKDDDKRYYNPYAASKLAEIRSLASIIPASPALRGIHMAKEAAGAITSALISSILTISLASIFHNVAQFIKLTGEAKAASITGGWLLGRARVNMHGVNVEMSKIQFYRLFGSNI
mgnify:CR=1 FL=1